MAKIFIESGQISKLSVKKYNYPFEELKDIINSFVNRMWNNTTEIEFKNVLDEFKHKLAHEYDIREDELNKIIIKHGTNMQELKKNILLSLEGFVKCGNLFTACILYGKYVPYDFIKGLNAFSFKDGYKIEYSDEHEEFILLRKVEVDRNIKEELLKWEEDKLKWEKEQKQKAIDFEKENPGVPLDSVKLEKNKKYSGRAEGDFEVKTINNEIWIIPDTSCFDFGEI